MKRMLSLCAATLCLTLTLTPTALAADFESARYRTPRSATPPPSSETTMAQN